MKNKLIAVLLLAGASAFAQTRFSIQIGSSPAYGYAPDYNGYGYGDAPPRIYTRDPAYGGSSYWGVDSYRAHHREEWRGRRYRHEQELDMYRNDLRHHRNEERYEHHDSEHGSAYDGMRRW